MRARSIVTAAVAALLAVAGVLVVALEDGARAARRRTIGSPALRTARTTREVAAEVAGPAEAIPAERLLKGRVLEAETERPVAGARVTLALLPARQEIRRGGPTVESQAVLRDAPVEPLTETRTDADGRFTLGAPASGAVLLAARQGTEPPVRYVVRDVARGEEPVLRLPAFVQLDVRAVGREDDQPVPDARVRLYDVDDDTPPREILRTDAQGRVTFRVPRGDPSDSPRVYVRVDADGYATAMPRVDSPDGPLEIRLWRGWALEGVAVSTDGEPIAGLALSIDLACRDAWHSLEIVRITDESGRFRFEGLDERLHRIRVVDPRFAMPKTMAAAGRPPRGFVVHRSASIEGAVRDPQGHAVPGLSLGIPGNPAYGGSFTVSDAEGRFRLDGLLPGVWSLEVADAIVDFYGDTPAPRRVLPAPMSIDLVEGARLDAVEVVVEVRPLSWAVVRLRDAGGDPIQGAAFRACAPRGLVQEAQHTGRDGIARLPIEAPPGTIVVLESEASSARRHLQAVATCRTVADPGVPPVEARLPEPVTVRAVVCAQGGAPLPDHLDVEVDLHGSGYEMPVQEREAGFPARHQRWFSVQPGMEFHLVASPRSPWYAWRTTYEGFAAADGSGVRIELAAAGRMTGRIVDAEGRPFRHARARLAPPCGGLGGTTEDDGSFELTNLPQGEWTLELGPELHPPERSLPVRVEANVTLDLGTLVLPRLVLVAGRVVDERGYRVEACRLLLLGPSGGGLRIPPAARELDRFPDGDGRFTVSMVPDGSERLLAYAPGFGSALVSAADLATDIVLRTEGRLRLRVPGLPTSETARWCAAVGRVGSPYLWRASCEVVGEELLLQGLPAGRLRVVVGPRGTSDPIELEADIVAGATATLTLQR